MNPASDHEAAREFVQNAVVQYQAPLVRYAARLLGDLVLGRPPSLDAAPFDPARVMEPAGATGG